MSILELLKTVDTLAKIINQKNRELEELKMGYDIKLQEINRYIEIFQQQEGVIDDERMTEEEFRETIINPVKCDNCDHELWNVNGEGEFIIISKRKLQYVLREERNKVLDGGIEKLDIHEGSSSDVNSEIRPTSAGLSLLSPTPKGYRKHYHNKSKKTCSYCSKPGHSRANCLVRLATPTK